MRHKKIKDLDDLLKKKKQENEALRKILEKLDEKSNQSKKKNDKSL